MTKAQEKRVVFFVGLGLLLLIGAAVLFGPEKNSGFAYVALRATLGLAAAAFVILIPGFLELNWPPLVRAGGAVAAFAIVYLVNPPAAPVAAPPVDPIPNTIEGHLGTLQDHLQNSPTSSEFVLTLSPTYRDELQYFWIESPISGPTWGEVVSRICRRYECLVCTPPPDKIVATAEIAWRRPPKRIAVKGNEKPKYTCAQATIGSTTTQ